MKLDVIYNENCLEGMKNIPDESIDLIVTDPPYQMRYKTNYRVDKNHKFCKEIYGDNDENLIRQYVSECYRILKNNSALYIFCNVNKVELFKSELEKNHFNIKNMIIWVKNNWSAGDLKAQFGKQYEILFYVNKGRCPIRGKRLTDVWEFPRVSGKKQLHQHQKPIDLIKRCIEKSSNLGDVVFDGFIGSGTTSVACLETGRHYIGYEIDQEDFKIAQKRIEDCRLKIFN